MQAGRTGGAAERPLLLPGKGINELLKMKKPGDSRAAGGEFPLLSHGSKTQRVMREGSCDPTETGGGRDIPTLGWAWIWVWIDGAKPWGLCKQEWG